MSKMVRSTRKNEAIVDGFEIDWQKIRIPAAQGRNGAGLVALKILGWCVSTQNHDGDWTDFYTVTLTAELQYSLDDPLHVDGYRLTCRPQTPSGDLIPAVALIDCTPAQSGDRFGGESDIFASLESEFGCFTDKFCGAPPSNPVGHPRDFEGLDAEAPERPMEISDGSFQWHYDFARSLDPRTVRLDLCHQMLFQVSRSAAPEGLCLRTEMGIDFSGHLAQAQSPSRELYFIFSGGKMPCAEPSGEITGKYRRGRIELNPHICPLRSPALPQSE